MNRRKLILSSATTLILPAGFIPQPAYANPLVGIFGRILFSQFARSSAGRIVAKTATRAITKKVVRKALKPSAKKQADTVQKNMAKSENGGFTNIVSEISGELAGDIVSEFLTAPKKPQVSVIHAENPHVSGAHGLAQCVAFTNGVKPNAPSVTMEAPEIVALEKMRQNIEASGQSDKTAADIMFPIDGISKGNFRYDTGHRTPSIFESKEGFVRLSSTVSRHGSRSKGVLKSEFQPKSGSRFEGFEVDWTVLDG